MALRATVILDDRAIELLLTSPAGPVGEYLGRLGQRVAASARRRAPISPTGSHGRRPGHLRGEIRFEVHHDVRGVYVDILSPARTGDARNFPYGAAQNVEFLRGAHGGRIKTTPHLQPALYEIIGSL